VLPEAAEERRIIEKDWTGADCIKGGEHWLVQYDLKVGLLFISDTRHCLFEAAGFTEAGIFVRVATKVSLMVGKHAFDAVSRVSTG
jgi:hypothetical protein